MLLFWRKAQERIADDLKHQRIAVHNGVLEAMAALHGRKVTYPDGPKKSGAVGLTGRALAAAFMDINPDRVTFAHAT